MAGGRMQGQSDGVQCACLVCGIVTLDSGCTGCAQGQAPAGELRDTEDLYGAVEL